MRIKDILREKEEAKVEVGAVDKTLSGKNKNAGNYRFPIKKKEAK